MRHEIVRVAEQLAAAGGRIRLIEKAGQDPVKEMPVSREESLVHRKTIREQTDKLIDRGLAASAPLPILQSVCETMTALAAVCAQVGIEPSTREMLIATKELIEDARVVVDKGLQLAEWEQVRIGVAMLEIVLTGLTSRLNMPYHRGFEIMHTALMANQPDDITTAEITRGLTIILMEAGYAIAVAE